MKKKAFTRYICVIRSMHMRPSRYAEMMEWLEQPEKPEIYAAEKTEANDGRRFQWIPAVAICLLICVTAGLFAYFVRGNSQISVGQPGSAAVQEASGTEFAHSESVLQFSGTLADLTEIISASSVTSKVSLGTSGTFPAAEAVAYEPVNISKYIYKSLGAVTYTDLENALSWYAHFAMKKKKTITPDVISTDYIWKAAELVELIRQIPHLELTAEQKERWPQGLCAVHYQYTEDRRLYVLIANLTDDTKVLECDRASIFMPNQAGGFEETALHFRLPDYPYGWMQPYLSGTVKPTTGERDYIAQIAPHSMIELCAVLPDSMEIDPVGTPRIVFSRSDDVQDERYVSFEGNAAINWQEPDLSRPKENELLREGVKAHEAEMEKYLERE